MEQPHQHPNHYRSFTLNFKYFGLCASLPSYSRILISKWTDLDHWATVHSAQVRYFQLFNLSTVLETLPSSWINFSWQACQGCGHACCLYTFSFQLTPVRLPSFNIPLCTQTAFSAMTCQWSSSGRRSSEQSAPCSYRYTIYNVWIIIYPNSKWSILKTLDTLGLTKLPHNSEPIAQSMSKKINRTGTQWQQQLVRYAGEGEVCTLLCALQVKF